MGLSRKAKEAVKTGLALALVYGIALGLDWLNPYWAALAVAMISLQTAGESIHKGMDRMAGTIPGIIAGIIILSVASQDRWAFMLLTSLWIFFITYMQLQSRKNPYFWMTAGFVCLAIVSAVGSSSEYMFERIAYRILETALGISVYTLVSVFLWPKTNAGAIKNAGRDLMATQARICDAGRKRMTGTGTPTGEKIHPVELHQQELAQVAQLGKALIAEGSENYEVYELRHFWDRFQNLSMALMESLDRWQTGMADLVQKDVNAVLPGVNTFFHELDCRFKEIGQLLEGYPAKHKLGKISLDIHTAELDNLSHFDRAAFLATGKELKNIETLTADLLECVRSITGQAGDSQRSVSTAFPGTKSPGINFFVFDRDQLRSAAYASTAFCVGFFIWIFVDPPGHSGWYLMLGIMSFCTVSAQQVRMSLFIKPIAVAVVLASFVYIIIMPKLSTYMELGGVLFSCMFINRYFFSGLAQAMGNVGIVNMIPIQNQQTYDFAMQANTCLYMVMVFCFLFALSYIINAPRPEKKVLAFVKRFFRSAEFLVSQLAREPGPRPTLINQWKKAFYQHEMKSLPAKISVWGRSINPALFPNNTPAQVQSLVTDLQCLMYRIEELFMVWDEPTAKLVKKEMGEDSRKWRERIETLFGIWSNHPAPDPSTDLKILLEQWIHDMEKRLDTVFDQVKEKQLSQEEEETFYCRLRGYRGVSEATVAYAKNAAQIDWGHWREERFQ